MTQSNFSEESRRGKPVHLASWPTLAGALILYFALNYLVVFVLFPSGTLGILSRPTAGLVSSTLLANASMSLVLLVFLKWFGGLTANDLGLRSNAWIAAIALTVAVWLALNLFQIVWAAIERAPLAVNPDWHRLGTPSTLGRFLGQLLGNALFEEVLFRGLFFQQISLHLMRGGVPRVRALVFSLVISQAIFAVAHVPLRLSSGMTLGALPAELALLFVLGVMLALLYWRTGNLFLVVGIHALSNAPLLIVQERVDLSTYGVTAAGASLVIILLWSRVVRCGHVFSGSERVSGTANSRF